MGDPPQGGYLSANEYEEPESSVAAVEATATADEPEDQCNASDDVEAKKPRVVVRKHDEVMALPSRGGSLSATPKASGMMNRNVKRRLVSKQPPPEAFQNEKTDDDGPGQRLRRRLLSEFLERRAKKLKKDPG